ncbi:MAG: GNAT family N-acetyltransferase [Deltaproteobacteria bacterium]|nr:GNAT family N-acetyltransferase [Deltaproteobacteria bacterium]
MDVQLAVPLAEDRELIAGWLRRDHVKRWWGEPDDSVAEAAADGTRGRAIIMAGGRKVGLILWAHPTRAELDEAGLTDVSTSVVDIDLMIGEEDAIGRGFGPRAIGLAVERILADPAVPRVMAAAMVANAASIRAFEKAGFQIDRDFDDSGYGRCVLLLYSRTRRLDAGYAEDVELRDGTRVRLRLVRAGDKQLFLDAWERVSPDSRYRRFLSVKTSLSESELRYLTEVDQVAHFAIGAAVIEEGREIGVGVARFVLLPDRPDTAEPAILITDDFQGRGLGRLLLARLVDAARERGVERFVSLVLATNEAMQELLRDLAPTTATTYHEGGIVSFEIPLGEAEAPGGERAPAVPGALHRLLRSAAEGVVRMRRTIAELIGED